MSRGLAQPVREFDLAREDFLAVIDGMEMDTRRRHPRARASPRSTFIATASRARSGGCRCACSASSASAGKLLAHHLGRALQLTNILRDLDEDAAVGRLYLPREALQQAGITTTDPATALRSPTLAQACAEVVERAREHFAEADKIMARAARAAVRAPRIMGEVYRSILDRLVARGFAPPRQPVRMSARAARLDPVALRADLMPRTIHIIGAGLAGLAAAVELAERGETRGRARGHHVRGRALPLLSRRTRSA